MNHGPKNRTLVVPLLLGIAAVVFVAPAWRSLDNWGIQDWDIAFLFHESPRVTILEHRQFPLWNPWFCGGMPLLARPESPFLSPAFLLTLALGAVRALKIQILVYLLAGLWGTYALARQVGVGRTGAALSAVVYMFSGPYTAHLVGGNSWILSMGLIPWVLLFFLRAAESVFVNALVCSVLLVLMWFAGSPYLLVMSLLLLGVYACLGVLLRRMRPGRCAVALALIALMTLGLGAVKFFPAIEFTVRYPRRHDLYSGFSLDSLRYALLARDQTVHAVDKIQKGAGLLHGVSQGMNETGTYVGVIPLALCLVGAAVQGRRRAGVLGCCIVFLWLSFGVRIPVSPWNLLHRLPVFDIMRVPERFRILFLLCLALLAGSGLDAAGDGIRRLTGRASAAAAVEAALAAAAGLDLMLVVSPLFKETFTIRPLAVAPAAGRAFVQTASHYAIRADGWAREGDDTLRCAWSSHYPALLANQGIVFGAEEIPVPEDAIPVESPRYRGEVFVLGSTGSARYVKWSPNSLRMAVRVNGQGHLVINQNYYPGWRVRGGGRRVERVGGLLAVRVGPADREVEIYYRPWSFVAGAWVSGLTLAGLAAWGWLKKRKGRGNRRGTPRMRERA